MLNREFFENISAELHPRSLLFLSVDLTRSSEQKQPIVPKENYHSFTDEDPSRENPFDPVARSMQQYLDDHWFSYLTEFYQKYHQIFLDELQVLIDADSQLDKVPNLSSKCSGMSTDRIKIWKLAGDEIIYAIDVDTEDEIYMISLAFLRSITFYRKILYDDVEYFHSLEGREFKGYRDQFSALYSKCILDVKGAIWWAGFPISNREVVISDELKDADEISQSTDPRFRNLFSLREAIRLDLRQKATTNVDYLGPSIDIGFRLAGLSTSKRLTISAEVAYLLNRCDSEWSRTIESLSITRKKLEIKFSGRQSLKGVFGLKPYPIFWLDSSSSEGLSFMEEEMLGGEKSQDPERLQRYFDRFFQRHSRYIMKPELINMDDTFSDSSLVCKVIKRIDIIWREEQSRQVSKVDIYSNSTE